MFLDRNHVRILEGSDGPRSILDGTIILEFDVDQKRLQETGRISTQSHNLRYDSTRTRILAVFRQKGASQLALCDGRTGGVIKVITEWAPGLPIASFLADGRILVSTRGSAESFLRVFSAEGELLRTCPLGPSRVAAAGSEVTGGKIVIETWERRTKLIDAKDVRLFDPATGDLQVIPSLRPSQDWWQRAEAEQPQRGGVTSWFFPDDQGKLVRYDFESGKVTPVKF
jgi:hypothetical protein